VYLEIRRRERDAAGADAVAAEFTPVSGGVHDNVGTRALSVKLAGGAPGRPATYRDRVTPGRSFCGSNALSSSSEATG
jgi:hypothetical protein